MVNDEVIAALELNYDLDCTSLWAWQWKTQFNTEKLEELICSANQAKPQNPPLQLGSNAFARKTEHRHLGVILDEKLSFKSHIREAVINARWEIGMKKFLSKYRLGVLDQIYKLFIRPHLHYSDIICHKNDLNVTKRLKKHGKVVLSL